MIALAEDACHPRHARHRGQRPGDRHPGRRHLPVGVCVGHTAELTEICERGLDEVVERAHAKFLAYRFDALHLAAGTATLVDADADRTADALTAGRWTTEINAGQGLRAVPATFTATR